MMAFPSMIAPAAEGAGMAVPPDPDNYDKEEYPHFFVFCQVQLGVPMQPNDHWENAKVIAKIPTDELKTLGLQDLVAKGLHIHT